MDRLAWNARRFFLCLGLPGRVNKVIYVFDPPQNKSENASGRVKSRFGRFSLTDMS